MYNIKAIGDGNFEVEVAGDTYCGNFAMAAKEYVQDCFTACKTIDMNDDRDTLGLSHSVSLWYGEQLLVALWPTIPKHYFDEDPTYMEMLADIGKVITYFRTGDQELFEQRIKLSSGHHLSPLDVLDHWMEDLEHFCYSDMDESVPENAWVEDEEDDWDDEEEEDPSYDAYDEEEDGDWEEDETDWEEMTPEDITDDLTLYAAEENLADGIVEAEDIAALREYIEAGQTDATDDEHYEFLTEAQLHGLILES